MPAHSRSRSQEAPLVVASHRFDFAAFRCCRPRCGRTTSTCGTTTSRCERVFVAARLVSSGSGQHAGSQPGGCGEREVARAVARGRSGWRHLAAPVVEWIKWIKVHSSSSLLPKLAPDGEGAAVVARLQKRDVANCQRRSGRRRAALGGSLHCCRPCEEREFP